MKYRTELIVWAYTDEGQSLGCVYESESQSVQQGYEMPRKLSTAAWKKIKETAETLVAVEKVPRMLFGIYDYQNHPVPGTRAATQNEAIRLFLAKRKIKWWYFQKRLGYYDGNINPHGDYCRCLECEGR